MKKKKILKIIVGTNNVGKLEELRALLPKNIKIYSPKDFKLRSPRENGRSFKDNSLIKARYYSENKKIVCLADDSGLEIDILGKKPGIFSSRWADPKGNFNIAIKKIFKALNKKDKNWMEKKIIARFVCALSLYWPNGKSVTSIGKIEGTISSKKKGKNGFGYDPIFVPLKKKNTFAEMNPKEKFKIDHRFNAYKKIKKFF